MRLFKCQACGQAIYFENRFCETCGHALGYLPISGELTAIEPDGGNYVALTRKRPLVRYCENIEFDACNWLIAADQDAKFCLACRPNHTIPDLSIDENLFRWQQMEVAKHRLFYTLIALKLPLKNLVDDPQHGLAFDFPTDDPEQTTILTGHDAGLITINLNEADDAYREKLRHSMGEPYRTLLGHFRHEVGHYFWDLLVRDAGRLEQCRAVFGDERQDYAAALERHYAQGAPPDWQKNFISAYATAHPWEDFAESWAHYMHIVDTLETASTFGLRIHPMATKNKALHANIDFDPHYAASVAPLIEAWLPLTFALNNLNRSMGYSDMYPFILSQPVIKKMQFIHEVIHQSQVERKPPGARKGFFRRATAPMQAPPMQAAPMQAAPEQPPAPAPLPPGGPVIPPPPGPDIPQENPPIVEPPNDPLPDHPPVELPPGPDETPTPIPDEVPTVQMGLG
jgi:hypothetical protein